MKKAIILIGMALLTSLGARAQQNTMVAFAGEATVKTQKKEEVMKRLTGWYQENRPQEVLREVNAEKGELAGTSFMRYTSGVQAAGDLTEGYILYDFKLVASEAGFQYTITNFRHEARIKFHTITTHSAFPYKISAVEKPWYDLVWKDIRQQVSQHVPQLIDSLRQSIENPVYSVRAKDKAREDAVLRLLQARTTN